MRILHVTHHSGCAADIQAVVQRLNGGFELETLLSEHLQDTLGSGCARYNVSAHKARETWRAHSSFFNSFDKIVVSDTTPLARIFLDGGYHGHLIIWVCNRFDYADMASNDCGFPDAAYYDLMRRARKNARVSIVSYTPFETVYARRFRGVDLGREVIRPLGMRRPNGHTTLIPYEVVRHETFFVPSYHNDTVLMDVRARCEDAGLRAYCGRYAGPGDLAGFKGIVHIPYAWSNFALFEQLQLGTVFFVPSRQFLLRLCRQKQFFWQPQRPRWHNLGWAEWYHRDLQNLFVYFDSWDDLARKAGIEDLHARRRAINAFTRNHTKSTLDQWNKLLQPRT